MLKLGLKAPAFSLLSTSGSKVALRDFKGRTVVLYFYPRDNTPGCTTEACDFRDHYAALRKAGVVVLGVSSDSLKSHEGFRKKHDLPFDLLVDEDHAIATKYEAYGEKMMYGKKVQGVIRSTFLIDPDGRLTHIWSPVKVAGHVAVRSVQRPPSARPNARPSQGTCRLYA
jgi:peroxiredoxin Q/BCP